METSSVAYSPLLLTCPPLVDVERWILPLFSPSPRTCFRCSLRLLFPREEPPGANPQARETREVPALAPPSSTVYALNVSSAVSIPGFSCGPCVGVFLRG